ncbi:hypothetical protein [Staphylococcus aureus]
MSAALQYFDENLPHRPYHTDDLAFGLRISGKGRALLARYIPVSYTHLRAHETLSDLVCRLLLEKTRDYAASRMPSSA